MTVVTMQHEREVLAIVQLAVDMQEDKQQLALVLTDSHEHVRWLISKLHDATAWDKNNVKLFREGLETKWGGKILIRTVNNPEVLMGLKPDRILLMGRVGELFYHLKAMGVEVEALG